VSIAPGSALQLVKKSPVPALADGIVNPVQTEDSDLGRNIALGIASTLMLLTLWALTHHYQGIVKDGELYAFQALSRLQPSLKSDLYLRNTSQDNYTVFSPLYAVCIGILGLRTAALVLFSVCSVWFFTVAWFFVRRLSTAEAAWISVALLIVTPSVYGAYQVFSYSENYLSARSLAEALTLTALAVHFGGWRRMALLIAALSLFVHPLMSLPGILVLLCLWLPETRALTFAAAGLIATLTFALVAAHVPIRIGLATVMDPTWTDVVRERAQFLFLEYWMPADWEIAARPFVSLTLTALVFPEPRVRKLCLAAMLVGVCGIIVAAIAGAVGPIAILLQGQAWRWLWIPGCLSVLLLGPAALRIWRDDRCGVPCATLLIVGWTYSGVDGLACVTGALALWLVRNHVSLVTARHLRWASISIVTILVIWLMANLRTYISAPIPESGRESIWVGRIREFFALGISGLLLMWFSLTWVRRVRSFWVISLICGFFLAASSWILPGSMKQLDTVGSIAEIDEYADWRGAIPASSNVLLIPTRQSASFIWFSLGRPSYLTVAQSAGVVFSRDTALEVRRRSEVLLPLRDPDWKILTAILRARARTNGASHGKPGSDSRPLTASILVGLCGDPQLDFVIAKDWVGYAPLKHLHPGALMNWYLYDCRRVRPPSRTT
jgi:hypothetical protein